MWRLNPTIQKALRIVSSSLKGCLTYFDMSTFISLKRIIRLWRVEEIVYLDQKNIFLSSRHVYFGNISECLLVVKYLLAEALRWIRSWLSLWVNSHLDFWRSVIQILYRLRNIYISYFSEYLFMWQFTQEWKIIFCPNSCQTNSIFKGSYCDTTFLLFIVPNKHLCVANMCSNKVIKTLDLKWELPWSMTVDELTIRS